MKNRIELRIDIIPKNEIDVYFWQNGQRSKMVYLDGGEEELQVKGTFITENISAWAKLTLQKVAQNEKENKGWMVMCQSNIVDTEMLETLEKVKQNIEIAIRQGIETRIDITEELIKTGCTIVQIHQ